MKPFATLLDRLTLPEVYAVTNTVSQIRLDPYEVEYSRSRRHAFRNVRGWSKLKLSSGMISKRLRCQLAIGFANRSKIRLGSTAFYLDSFNVLDKIAELESVEPRSSGVKKSSRFRGPVLRDLWHSHWFQANFIPQNLLNEADRMPEGTIQRLLAETYEDGVWEGKVLGQKQIGRLAHYFAVEQLEARSRRSSADSFGRLTGEWIVYAKTQLGNRYLTLSSHSQSDEEISLLCWECLKEFPELREQPVFQRVKPRIRP